MKVIKDVADLTLPKRKKVKSTKEIWKDDEKLNLLLMEREKSQRSSQSYRSLTKTIKKQIINKLS